MITSITIHDRLKKMRAADAARKKQQRKLAEITDSVSTLQAAIRAYLQQNWFMHELQERERNERLNRILSYQNVADAHTRNVAVNMALPDSSFDIMWAD